MSYFIFFTNKDFYLKILIVLLLMDLAYVFFYIEFLQPLKKSSHKNPRSEDALSPLLYFVGVRLRQMCNWVICSRPCQSNAESAGMPHLKTLVTRITLVTWHWCFKTSALRISTPCRNVSFASAIPTKMSCMLEERLMCVFSSSSQSDWAPGHSLPCSEDHRHYHH